MKIVFLPVAERDLGDLFTYIKEELRNPTAAQNIATKILQRINMLTNFPEIGANLNNIDARFKDYRHLIVDNYLVVYSVSDREVCIVRILFARSDYIHLLQG